MANDPPEQKEKMNSRIKIIAVLLISVVLSSYLLLRLYVGTNYFYDRDFANQERLVRAILAYHRNRNGVPASLQQLAAAGYLPRNGSFYREPPGVWKQAVTTDLSSYVLVIGQDNVPRIVRRTADGRLEFNPVIGAEIRSGLVGGAATPSAKP
jgi:hypothetical protein